MGRLLNQLVGLGCRTVALRRPRAGVGGDVPTSAGLAAGAVGCYLGGALGSLPGAATTLFGAHRMWSGVQEQKQAQIAQTDAAAVAAHLKDQIDAQLSL